MLLTAHIWLSCVWVKLCVYYSIVVISSVWAGVRCSDLQVGGRDRSYDVPQLPDNTGESEKWSVFKNRALYLTDNIINAPHFSQHSHDSFGYGSPKQKRQLFLSATSTPLKCRDSWDFEFHPSNSDEPGNGRVDRMKHRLKKRSITSRTYESARKAKLSQKKQAMSRGVGSKPFVNRDTLIKSDNLKRQKREREGCCPMTCPPPSKCPTCCSSCRPACFTCGPACPFCGTTKYSCLHICNSTCPPYCLPPLTPNSRHRGVRRVNPAGIILLRAVKARNLVRHETLRPPFKCTTRCSAGCGVLVTNNSSTNNLPNDIPSKTSKNGVKKKC